MGLRKANAVEIVRSKIMPVQSILKLTAAELEENVSRAANDILVAFSGAFPVFGRVGTLDALRGHRWGTTTCAA